MGVVNTLDASDHGSVSAIRNHIAKLVPFTLQLIFFTAMTTIKVSYWFTIAKLSQRGVAAIRAKHMAAYPVFRKDSCNLCLTGVAFG
jgi:hypothetical protein